MTTIIKVRHGSHAYGLNIATSDLDVKGVRIEEIGRASCRERV